MSTMKAEADIQAKPATAAQDWRIRRSEDLHLKVGFPRQEDHIELVVEDETKTHHTPTEAGYGHGV
ncbi:MAG: hypothetical protein ABI643_00825 [Candidatus Doudnabacteria bacterium]